ncbi:DNA methyltransferase [Phenylobacterium sp.]|uniref:site-specific DNA-methyltransferase n=1 Tax=Phenylobacterium sp. TaxID=1871053 RepID=UPI00286E397F|nr:DNA methyltransferase [Phenylobacterium sp.]
MTSLEIQYRKPAELKPHPTNARIHSAKQIDQIAASIVATMFANPILIDENDVIIAGHGRLLAAKKLRLDEVPTIQLRGLSEGQKRALRLADNKIALNSGFDLELLKIELEELRLLDVDLELTGFSVGELDVLFEGQADPEDEVVPAAPAEPVSQTGDIWTLGPHRVACGDVRDKSLMARLMAGGCADAAFLDPPYNVKIDGHAGGKGKVKHREFAFASGEMSPAEFIDFLKETHGACAEASRNGAIHYICMDHHHVGELRAAIDAVYGQYLNMCVWVKSNAGMGSLYRSQHELVFVYRVGDAPHRNNVELGKHGRNRTNVWEYPSVNTFGGSRRHDLAMHPTVKPVAMVADAIKDVTKPGETVLDAFLGSGTTLIAAERSARVCRGVEIDPVYVDVALARWSAITGLEPVLEGSGETITAVRARRAATKSPLTTIANGSAPATPPEAPCQASNPIPSIVLGDKA